MKATSIPSSTPTSILFLVIGTICTIAVMCVSTMAYMSTQGLQPHSDVFSALKDATTFILGALTGVLVNTRQLHQQTKELESEKPAEAPTTQS